MIVATMEQMRRIADRAVAAGGWVVARAGTPVVKSASQGMEWIKTEAARAAAASNLTPAPTLGVLAGLTLIKNSAAFTAPELKFETRTVKNGFKRTHYAKLCRTTATDVTHDSYYPGAGDHVRSGLTTRVNGEIMTYYWRVTPAVSEKIRQGEEEHLADARRAWELTYQCVADAINSLAGKEFTSTTTPYDAEQAARAALDNLLPLSLRGGPANWPRTLDRLLGMTRTRDTSHWHDISGGPMKTVGKTIIIPVEIDGAHIGQHPSGQVVNY